MRIGGLASGMDIDSIVGELMTAERVPLDKMFQKRQTLEWQRDDYRSMNTILKELDTFIFDGINKRSNLTTKRVSSSDESVVTATATAAAGNTTANISVSKLATSATWIGSGNENFVAGSRTLNIGVTNGDGSTSTASISILDTDTLNDVINKLNTNKELGVVAFHDPQLDKIVMTKKDTGSSAALTITDDDTATFFNQLGFASASTGGELGSTLTEKTAGTNAEFSINGLTTSRTSNTFSINDVTYTLKNKSQAGTSVTVTTSTDTDKIMDNVVKFVEKYNEVIGKINSKVSETHYRSYKPLTDKEKEAMTEKQIELWEEKAKSGLIRNDALLIRGLNQLRTDAYTKVAGTANTNFDQLAEIGITTSTNYLDKGKLVINETKLRQAIEADPNAIYELFNKTGTTEETKGIAVRFRETIKDTITSIEKKAGNNLRTNQQFMIGRDLNSLNDQITKLQDRLNKVEDRYWRQFTAMEKAIQRSNDQSMYLMNAFGS